MIDEIFANFHSNSAIDYLIEWHCSEKSLLVKRFCDKTSKIALRMYHIPAKGNVATKVVLKGSVMRT